MLFRRYQFGETVYQNFKDEINSRNMIASSKKSRLANKRFYKFVNDPSDDFAINNGHNRVKGIDIKSFISFNGYDGVLDCIFPSAKHFSESVNEDANDFIDRLDAVSSGHLKQLWSLFTEAVEFFIIDLALSVIYSVSKLDWNYFKDWSKAALEIVKAIIGKLLC